MDKMKSQNSTSPSVPSRTKVPTVSSSLGGTVKKAEPQGGLGQAGRAAGGIRGRSEMEQHFDKLRALDKLEDGADSIGPKGLAQLCAEINVPFNELDFYILMWKIGATQSYCVTRSEWVHAAYVLKIEHVGQLKSNLNQWKAALIADKQLYTEFYYAIFDFIRADDDKWLPLDKALRAWAVLLPEADQFKLLSLWAQWCTLEYKRPISRDVWRELLEFAKKVNELTEYDPNEKWPTAFDDFVEWALEKRGMAPSKPAK